MSEDSAGIYRKVPGCKRLCNILRCTEQPLQQRITELKMTVLLRLRNPGLEDKHLVDIKRNFLFVFHNLPPPPFPLYFHHPGEGKVYPLQHSGWRIPRTVQSTGSQSRTRLRDFQSPSSLTEEEVQITLFTDFQSLVPVLFEIWLLKFAIEFYKTFFF